ncbi:RNA polymerase ECF-type sigma factor [Pedobacter sp. BAL39]|uniref:RNA polymerase sigma factor n=1 Tax=Pedobacter sp. BAL39 TaxID=391596 RepID=UPI000155A138|nr:RNA polymerase sigma-70 factor [Pedobacter sp. BAL39]EDM36016.1 RNA polymerase ECF-type sigma factor [Pedobacter sp. BAL39]
MATGWTEQDTIIALKAGDESAFRKIFDLNFRKLYTFSFRLLKNKEQAEEVVHDTLMNVWMNRDRINPDFPIAPYLYTITRRLALNALRQIATSQKAIDQLWLNMEKVSNDTEESILKEDLQRFTEAALVNLPPQQQQIFRMSRFDGLNYDEIAEKLNISRNTVKNHLVAALKTLRIHFNQSDVICFLMVSMAVFKK